MIVNKINNFNSLLINSSPQGGSIFIDGNVLIDISGHAILTPVRVTGVGQGIHEVQISLDRYYSKKIFINVMAGKVNEVSIILQPIYE